MPMGVNTDAGNPGKIKNSVSHKLPLTNSMNVSDLLNPVTDNGANTGSTSNTNAQPRPTVNAPIATQPSAPRPPAPQPGVSQPVVQPTAGQQSPYLLNFYREFVYFDATRRIILVQDPNFVRSRTGYTDGRGVPLSSLMLVRLQMQSSFIVIIRILVYRMQTEDEWRIL